MDNKELFAQFPPVDGEVWKGAIEKLLKGKDYTETLVWRTIEGIDVSPFYRKNDVEGIETHRLVGADRKPGWVIGLPVNSELPIYDQLAVGVKHGAMAFKLNVHSAAELNLKELLQDIAEASFIEIDLEKYAGCDLVSFKEKWSKIEFSKPSPTILLGNDPFKRFLTDGRWVESEENDFQAFFDFWKELNAVNNQHKLIKVDGSFFQNAGANAAQELGYVLSLANEYLERLTDTASIKTLQNQFYFTLCSGANFQMELCKFRAFRVLWRNLLRSYGLEDEEHEPVLINAETATWNKTILDPHNNLLRLTTEIMAAAFGGTDCIYAAPYDSTFKKPDEVSQRLSLNLQLLLKHESFSDLTTDPAGGSYHYEHLTNELGEAGWAIFQEVQKEGGLIKYAKSEKLNTALEESKDKMLADFETKKKVLIGTNKYPNKQENIDALKVVEGDSNSVNLVIEPIKPFRLSQKAENERIITQQKDTAV